MANVRKDREREEYVEWLMQPKGLRVPSSKAAFAEMVGVERRTLYVWEADPDFQGKVRARKSSLGAVWYGDLLNTLKDIADDEAGRAADRISAVRVLLSHLDVSSDAVADKVDTRDVELMLERAGYKRVNG